MINYSQCSSVVAICRSLLFYSANSGRFLYQSTGFLNVLGHIYNVVNILQDMLVIGILQYIL